MTDVATLQPPTPLPVLVENIPETMRAEHRWVVWHYVFREGKDGKEGKWTKPPFIATAAERPAASTDPSTWRSFDEARAAYEDGKCDGLGFVVGDRVGGLRCRPH